MQSHTESWIGDVLEGLPPLLTVEDVMAVRRVSRRTVYRWIEGRRLRAYQSTSGGRWVVPRAALAEFLRGLQAA